MTRLPRFEYDLVRFLRFWLGHVPLEQVKTLFAEKRPAPPCLSPACVRLLERDLAKACVLFLVRSGGWRTDRFLRNDTPVQGRAWQRIPLDERTLSFGPHSLRFLIQALTNPTGNDPPDWAVPVSELLPGDQLFFLLAQTVAAGESPLALRFHPALYENPLGRLAFPTIVPAHGEPGVPDFDPWFAGPRVAMLECLQPWLETRWLRAEWDLGHESQWELIARKGRAMAAVLAAYLLAAERYGRRDLGRFFLRAESRILNVQGVSADAWTGRLEGEGPPRLQDRLDARRAALAGPHAFATLEQWTRSARGVGYFDEGYAKSQMWKEEWEAARGDASADAAKRVLAEVEPLRT